MRSGLIAARPQTVRLLAIRRKFARFALPAQDDVVVIDPESGVLGDGVDRMLETIVAERLDLAAVAADEVVMVIAARLGRLVVSTSRAKLEAMHEPELRQCLEGAVDACNADARAALPDEVVYLLDGHTARLLAERFDNGGPRASGLEAGFAEDRLRVLAPAHRVNDSDSHSC